MNKQSNVYTVIYIIVLVLVVGAALSYTSLSLKERQQANEDADKMRQILSAIHVTVQPGENVADTYNSYITSSYIIDADGNEKAGNAFAVNMAADVKKSTAERDLPVYCATVDGASKYILPVYGAGLWGPIWGYVAIDSDWSTVYGAYFSHQSETPGLGAEIEKPEFADKFKGKHLFKDGRFMPVAVVKAGQKPAGDEDYVDGVSGGTITSKGVSAMIDNCLSPYQKYLETKRKEM